MPQNHFNGTTQLRGVFALGLLVFSLSIPIQSADADRPTVVNTTITNAVTRYFTNVIEISVPRNVFVDQYRTNQVRREVVNVVDLYQTNMVVLHRTNVVTVDRYVTNVFTAWRTNVKTLALSLTNWENVVQIRTNWVNQPVTNFVDFTRTNLIVHTVTNLGPVFRASAAATSVPVVTGASEPLPSVRASDLEEGLELDLTHVGTPKDPGQFSVRLALRSASGATLPVAEWSVEKANGGGLMVGAKSEFATVLPAGSYRITARLRTADGVTRSVRGNTEIKTDGSAMRTPAQILSGR